MIAFIDNHCREHGLEPVARCCRSSHRPITAMPPSWLLEPIGNTSPAKAKDRYYAILKKTDMAAQFKPSSSGKHGAALESFNQVCGYGWHCSERPSRRTEWSLANEGSTSVERKSDPSTAIFVHSSWRTGSTYIWSCFRKSPRTVAYYEIFNEILGTLTKPQLAEMEPASWRSKHPPGSPYLLEFLPLMQDETGVDGFDPEMSYRRFIPADGCKGPVSEREVSYVSRLISHAESQKRIPVLTTSRSLGRVRGLKAAFPGLHVVLYRNSFQQWCSFTDQAFHGNPYFLDRVAEIVKLNLHDSILNLITCFPQPRSIGY